MSQDPNIFKSSQPNFLLLRLRGYDLKRNTEFIGLIKAIQMIHACAVLKRIMEFITS